MWSSWFWALYLGFGHFVHLYDNCFLGKIVQLGIIVLSQLGDRQR